MTTEPKGGAGSQLSEIEAIKECLDHLEDHVAVNGLPLAANLIGAASRALADEIHQQKARDQIWIKHDGPVFNA
jgi:hypothetical protein